MRIGVFNPARLAPTDRIFSLVGGVAQNIAIAPHGAVQRALYTTPTGKKFTAAHHCLSFCRNTAAAPVGAVELFSRVNSASAINARLSQIYCIDNTVGFERELSVLHAFTLQAAETFSIVDADSSTGGTCTYTIGYAGNEYDA